MATTTQPLPGLSSPVHFSPGLPCPSVLDSEPRHKGCQGGGPGPNSLLESGPGKVLIMEQAPNTVAMGHHVPSLDGSGSKFASSPPGP